MKALSLSIETVIVLIIAVIILGILTYFIMNMAKPGLDKMKWQQDASLACGRYIKFDETCTDVPSPSDCTANEQNALKLDACAAINILKDVCNKLEYSSCTGGTPSVNCIKQCCSVVCPKTNVQTS
ncbi:MAG: hypothetical protein ABIG30_03925 [Candidatus Aenigmatarchaeota archaeon]